MLTNDLKTKLDSIEAILSQILEILTYQADMMTEREYITSEHFCMAPIDVKAIADQIIQERCSRTVERWRHRT